MRKVFAGERVKLRHTLISFTNSFSKQELFIVSNCLFDGRCVEVVNGRKSQRQLRASLLTTLESFGRFPVLSSCSASTDQHRASSDSDFDSTGLLKRAGNKREEDSRKK
ncbi:hypothetical protein T07_4266 [Trichinella nelsoni]|uniref:Uncharacterized protein n=1 Tax=Trichinella nelsoni TaxID=6336 RepID=A0A0V0S5E1_9BILA|nr:hypothetical protein T07_4266 [Trichinella nelsoni]